MWYSNGTVSTRTIIQQSAIGSSYQCCNWYRLNCFISSQRVKYSGCMHTRIQWHALHAHEWPNQLCYGSAVSFTTKDTEKWS